MALTPREQCFLDRIKKVWDKSGVEIFYGQWLPRMQACGISDDIEINAVLNSLAVRGLIQVDENKSITITDAGWD